MTVAERLPIIERKMNKQYKRNEEVGMTNIREVAKKAGVGISTVSRALNETGYVEQAKKERIKQIASEMGYMPKQRRKTQGQDKSDIVGVILPDLSFPFYGTFLKFVEIELYNLGYKTMICNVVGIRERVSEMIDLVDKKELAGLIINADVLPDEMERLRKMPAVSFERILDGQIPMVASDHETGGKMAAKILWANGCKNVLIFGFKYDTKTHAEMRIEQCRKTLEQLGVQVNTVQANTSMLSYSYAEEIISQYLDIYSKVDGIFTSDVEAYCYLVQAKKRGINVPRDLKIVGYDGTDLTKMISPKITTIVQDAPLLARTCVQVLLRKIERESTQDKYLVPIKIQKGETADFVS